MKAKKIREFNVVIERDSEGYYVASVPVLRGCHTQAKSLDKLIERIQEAIDLCLEVDRTPVEPLWDLVIRARHISRLRPMLEAVLTGFGSQAARGGASATGEAVRYAQTAPLSPGPPAAAGSTPADAAL